MDTNIILPSSYLAPIEYYYHMIHSEIAHIDVYENYVKQTYRNRCRILSPNGVQNLTIPLVKARKKKLTKNVKISYEDNWRKVHWKSLEAAYRSSPYFEFYEDEFYPFYHKREYDYLIDFNWDLDQKIISLLNIEIDVKKSEKYLEVEEKTQDFRQDISPKNTNSRLSFSSYIQVFGDRNGFHPNLSILDLLFNEGPSTISYLKGLNNLLNV